MSTIQNPSTDAQLAELVRRCQRTLPDNTRAFEELVRLYKRRVIAVTYHMMGNPQDAEDISQEVFIKVFRGIRALENPDTVTGWIYRIAVNACLDALKAGQRRPHASAQWDLSDAPAECNAPDPHTPTPEQAALRNELRECLEDTLRELDDHERAVLVLCDIENRPYEEIARLLGVGLSACKMRIQRARLAFQRMLEQICPDAWHKAV